MAQQNIKPFNAVFLFLLAYGAHPAHCKEEVNGCEELGFTGAQLCSDCMRLGEYVKDKDLVSECQQCCVYENDGKVDATFEKAVLQACKWRVSDHPQIEGFIMNEAHKYPNLQVRYKLGSEPRLFLMDAQGSKNNAEAIRIDHWKTTEIKEYLRQKLKPS